MAKDLSISDMYDEALRKLKERRAQAGQASAAAFEKLAGKTSADYEALDNEAYVNKALADRAFGTAGDRMATIKQRRDSNLKNTLGKNKRQRQSFEDSVNLALKNNETWQAADDAALTAQFGAAENAALVSGGNFDAQLGLRQQQLDMDKQSSRFSNAYAMYTKGLIDRKQFKEWTGYEVRNWPKPKTVNTTPAVIYVGDEPPAQNTEGYVTRTVYIASIGLTRYYEVREDLVGDMDANSISPQDEYGEAKNDGQIYAEINYDGYSGATAEKQLEILEENKEDFIEHFGVNYFNLYTDYLTTFSDLLELGLPELEPLRDILRNYFDYASTNENGEQGVFDDYYTACNAALQSIADEYDDELSWEFVKECCPELAAMFEYTESTDDILREWLGVAPASFTSEAADALREMWGGESQYDIKRAEMLQELGVSLETLSAQEILSIAVYIDFAVEMNSGPFVLPSSRSSQYQMLLAYGEEVYNIYAAMNATVSQAETVMESIGYSCIINSDKFDIFQGLALSPAQEIEFAQSIWNSMSIEEKYDITVRMYADHPDYFQSIVYSESDSVTSSEIMVPAEMTEEEAIEWLSSGHVLQDIINNAPDISETQQNSTEESELSTSVPVESAGQGAVPEGVNNNDYLFSLLENHETIKAECDKVIAEAEGISDYYDSPGANALEAQLRRDGSSWEDLPLITKAHYAQMKIDNYKAVLTESGQAYAQEYGYEVTNEQAFQNEVNINDILSIDQADAFDAATEDAMKRYQSEIVEASHAQIIIIANLLGSSDPVIWDARSGLLVYEKDFTLLTASNKGGQIEQQKRASEVNDIISYLMYLKSTGQYDKSILTEQISVLYQVGLTDVVEFIEERPEGCYFELTDGAIDMIRDGLYSQAEEVAYQEFMSYTTETDFKKLSLQGAAIENPLAVDVLYLGSDVINPVMFAKYINSEEVMEELYNPALPERGIDTGQLYSSIETLRVMYSSYTYMTDDEVGVYNYLLAKEGEESANRFLGLIEETLNYRQGNAEAAEIEDNPLAQYLYSIPAGLDQFGSGIRQLFSSDRLPTSVAQYTSSAIYEDLADDGFKFPDWLGGKSLGQAVYSSGAAVGNMLPSIVITAATGGLGAPTMLAQGAGALLLGLSAKGNAYNWALGEGYTKSQAESYSILIGASEAGLQYLLGGISALGGTIPEGIITKLCSNINNAILKTATKLAIKTVSEGFEEYLQTMLEPVYRNIAFNENNEFRIWSEDAMGDFIVGALTAGIMEGGYTAYTNITTSKAGKAVIESNQTSALIEHALTLDTNTEAYKIASKLSENKVKTTNYNVGELLNAYIEAGGDISFMSVPHTNYLDAGTTKPDGISPRKDYNNVQNVTIDSDINAQTEQAVADSIRENTTNPNTAPKVKTALTEGMSALIYLEARLQSDSGNVNYSGFKADASSNAYVDFIVKKGSMESAATAMAADIRTAYNSVNLTAREANLFMGVLTDIVGSTELAEAYVEVSTANVDRKGESGYNKRNNGQSKIDTTILAKDKSAMTADDFITLREVAKQLEATPENAVKIGSEKTWKEFLDHNPSKDLRKSAEAYIKLIVETNPWPDGYKPRTKILPTGTKINMVMSSGQSDISPGGWATIDTMNNTVNDVRGNLAIATEFKSDIDRINTYEVIEDLPVKEGPVGPQIDLIADKYLPGGVTQEKLDVPPMRRRRYLRKIREVKMY